MTTIQQFVGADIAADSVTLEWQHPSSGQMGQLEIAQTAAAFQQLVKHLRQRATPGETQVVMEATGNYWMALAWALHRAGFAVSVLNPSQVRQFARAQLRRAKTDAIDAHLLADYARRMPTHAWTPPPAICEQLQQCLARREDLLHVRGAERNRLHALLRHPHPLPTLVEGLRQHLAWLEQEIQRLEATLTALLDSDHDWHSAAQRLLTIPGIGVITTAWILVATHNFARCQTPEQAASYAGLAPHPRQSGRSLNGHRSVGNGGHAPLRRALYMAAGSAARFNPPLKTFYDRLLQRGKLKKVARCAVARKLIMLAWAVVVKHRDFDPYYHSARHLALDF